MGQSILPRLYCNGIGMYRGSVNPTQAWWLGGWYLYRYSRSLWFSSLGHQKMLKEHFQQLKMFLKNFTLSKIYNELATKANTNTNTDMQMQIQIQLQGGVVTFSGIYCQTATGAKRSAAPFIAVSSGQLSAFGLTLSSSIGQSGRGDTCSLDTLDANLLEFRT